MTPTAKKPNRRLIERILEQPGQHDLHEQRDSQQVAPSVVRKPQKTDPRLDLVNPVLDPRRSTTNEDIERADGEGMAPVPPPRPHVVRKPGKAR